MIVIISPSLQHRPYFIQRREFVHIQALVSQSPVESFDEAVLGRLSWPYEVELHPSKVAPLVQHLRRKFRSVVDSYRVGQFALLGDFVQGVDYALARQRVIGLQRDAQAVPLVDHRQHPELPSAGQLIMDEVHGPVLAAARRHRHWPAVQADALAPTHSHTNLESLQLVEPMHTVAADPPALPYEQNVQALVAEARPGRRQLPKPLSQRAAVARLRPVVPSRVPEADQRAGPANTQLKTIPYPSRDVSTLGCGQIFFLTTS